MKVVYGAGRGKRLGVDFEHTFLNTSPATMPLVSRVSQSLLSQADTNRAGNTCCAYQTSRGMCLLFRILSTAQYWQFDFGDSLFASKASRCARGRIVIARSVDHVTTLFLNWRFANTFRRLSNTPSRAWGVVHCAGSKHLDAAICTT